LTNLFSSRDAEARDKQKRGFHITEQVKKRMKKRRAKELAAVNRINSYASKVSRKSPVVKQEKMVEVKREAAAAVARAPSAQDVMEALSAERAVERERESAVRAAKQSWLKKWKEEGLVKKEVGKTTGLEIAADEIESVNNHPEESSKDKLDYHGDQTDPVELLSSTTDSDMEEEDEEEVDEKVMKEEEEESDGFGDNSYWEEEMRRGEEAGK